MLNTLRMPSWIIVIILSSKAIAHPEISVKGKQIKTQDPQSIPEGSSDVGMPRFAEPIPNVTVSIGRDALLACVVENLKGYKVAWVRVDTQTILSIHHNVITQNPRISLSYNDHRSWYLHIKEVEENDRGWYMCQINTDPMRSRKGYLQVVVPPVIIEGMTSNDMVVREGTNVTLVCKARGYPEPYVMWRREDGEEMSIGGENVNVVDGDVLHITKVSRLHMAAYLCVASNGVPPSISKRVHLKVQFPPMLSIPNQLEGAYIGQDVILECHTEAYPASINYWTTERGDMIISDASRAGDKYETTSTTNAYSKFMKLKIRNVGPENFGSYRCVAKNSLGETDGIIKLDEIVVLTTAAASEVLMQNRSSGGAKRSSKKSNSLPDYELEEWKDAGDTNQPAIRHPPGAFHNTVSSSSSSPSLSNTSSLPSSFMIFLLLFFLLSSLFSSFSSGSSSSSGSSPSSSPSFSLLSSPSSSKSNHIYEVIPRWINIKSSMSSYYYEKALTSVLIGGRTSGRHFHERNPLSEEQMKTKRYFSLLTLTSRIPSPLLSTLEIPPLDRILDIITNFIFIIKSLIKIIFQIKFHIFIIRGAFNLISRRFPGTIFLLFEVKR